MSETKQKVKLWLKDKHNLALLGVLSLALVIRLYYFFIAKDQPLWWDESDYMAYAKHIAGFNVDWTVVPEHNSLFSFIVALFFKIGFSEAGIRFLLCVLPSFLLVFIVYKLCRLMYSDRRIALISAFLMATLWSVLFDSLRFHVENPSLPLAFLAIYIFWQGFEKKEKIFGKINPKFAIPLTVFLTVLSYGIRRGFFVFGFFFIFYMLLTKNFVSLIKDKFNWIALAIFIPLFLFLENLVFYSPIAETSKSFVYLNRPLTLVQFDIFSVFFKQVNGSWLSPLFYLFWIGLILLIFNLVINIGYFKKPENKSARSDLFLFLTFFIFLFIFIFIQRIQTIGDPRWYTPMLLAAFVCISKSALLIADYVRKYSKYFSIILIIFLIGYGGYYELQHADFIIKNKVNTFNGIKQASLFLMQTSNSLDIIISVPEPQTAYYAERKVLGIEDLVNNGKNGYAISFEEFLEQLRKPENNNVKYIITTFSEPGHPEWMRKDNAQSIQIPFMDTTIYFSGAQHDIKESKSYGNIKFSLIKIIDDAFVYKIDRL